MIKSLPLTTRYDCARECSRDKKCVLILAKANICNLYSKIDNGTFVSSQGSTYLLVKYDDKLSSINSNLVNYWPFNNDLNDVIGGAHMFDGVSYSFSDDRLNTPLSSIYLNNGYVQIPDGVYFNGDFTVTLWIKVLAHRYCSRIIDFGGSLKKDNICFGLSGIIFYASIIIYV